MSEKSNHPEDLGKLWALGFGAEVNVKPQSRENKIVKVAIGTGFRVRRYGVHHYYFAYSCNDG
jgi:hypothetical protein